MEIIDKKRPDLNMKVRVGSLPDISRLLLEADDQIRHLEKEEPISECKENKLPGAHGRVVANEGSTLALIGQLTLGLTYMLSPFVFVALQLLPNWKRRFIAVGAVLLPTSLVASAFATTTAPALASKRSDIFLIR